MVVWFFASSFFITKTQFEDDRRVRDNIQNGTTDEIVHIGKTLSELNKTTSEISAEVRQIQTDVAVIKATSHRNR